MKAADHERKGGEQFFQCRDQERLAEDRNAHHRLKLCHLVHGVEVINAFATVQIALVDRVDGL